MLFSRRGFYITIVVFGILRHGKKERMVHMKQIEKLKKWLMAAGIVAAIAGVFAYLFKTDKLSFLKKKKKEDEDEEDEDDFDEDLKDLFDDFNETPDTVAGEEAPAEETEEAPAQETEEAPAEKAEEDRTE